MNDAGLSSNEGRWGVRGGRPESQKEKKGDDEKKLPTGEKALVFPGGE